MKMSDEDIKRYKELKRSAYLKKCNPLIFTNHEDTLKIICDGKDIDRIVLFNDCYSTSYLGQCCYFLDLESVCILLEKGANPDFQYHEAYYMHNSDIITNLISIHDQGFTSYGMRDINIKKVVSSITYHLVIAGICLLPYHIVEINRILPTLLPTIKIILSKKRNLLLTYLIANLADIVIEYLFSDVEIKSK